MIRGTVIFDMDGVIFDTERLFLSCFQKITEDQDAKDMEAVFCQCIGVNEAASKAIFKKHYGERFSYEEVMETASKEFFSYVEENGMPMKPGVRELLDYLKENGYRIGLASSTREELVRTQLESRGLLSYFEVVICGDMVVKSKPEPDIYLKACEEMQCLPEEAYAIEDSYHGIHAAVNAGMKAIMVPDVVAADEVMKQIAVHIFSSLIEVKEFFEKENENN